MKEGIHPKDYRQVVFQDASTGKSFVTRSTVETDKTVVWEDGKEYPILKNFFDKEGYSVFLKVAAQCSHPEPILHQRPRKGKYYGTA